MLQGIENIVFDLGGVMIDLDRARCVEEFHKIGFTEIDDLIDSYHPKGFLGRLERGDVTNDDFYDYVRRSAGRDIADDEIRRAFTSFLAGIQPFLEHYAGSVSNAGRLDFTTHDPQEVEIRMDGLSIGLSPSLAVFNFHTRYGFSMQTSRKPDAADRAVYQWLKNRMKAKKREK